MRGKIKKGLLIKGLSSAILSIPIGIAAQTVTIENQNGTQSNLTLTEVNSIVFSSGNIRFNTNSCESMYFAQAITEVVNLDGTISTPEISVNDQLSVFPNPVESTFVLNVTDKQMNQPAAIYSASGEVVKKWTLTRRSSTVDVQDLPSGIYFIQIGSTNAKLIKQ